MSEAKAVVDSSDWIEMFTNGPLSEPFIAELDVETALGVLAISILEVFKWVLREHSEAQAIQAVAVMQRGLVVDLDSQLALADSIILTTARFHHARLYIMDSDFQGINDVEVLSRS